MIFTICKPAALAAILFTSTCSGTQAHQLQVGNDAILRAVGGHEPPSVLEEILTRLGKEDDRALVVRGILSSYYLKDSQADEYLSRYLELHPSDDAIASLARYWLAVTHLRSGRYAEAYAELRRVDDDPASDQTVGSIHCVAKALSGQPPMQASSAKPTSEVVKRNRLGHLLIPAVINGVHLDVIPDTGAAISFISETRARALAIRSLPHRCNVMTPGGDGVGARFGVASVRVGDVVVSKAVFAVIPDAAARLSGVDLQPLIGLPVLARAGSMSMALSGDQTFFATGGFEEGRKGLPANMFVAAFTLKAIFSVNGRNLIFDVDTGSNRTMIYPSERTKYLGQSLSGGQTLNAYTMSGAEGPSARYDPLTFNDGLRARTVAGTLKMNGAMQEGSDGRLGLDVLIDGARFDFNGLSLRFSPPGDYPAVRIKAASDSG
jgi:predicted aspartyl protease